MFDKVLIANRGEIAVRIARTLDAMGIDSVAVYAEADRDSLHVDVAGEACSLGPGGVSETYLDIDKLLGIVAESGAEAVHPGYGFLSENPQFATALETRGIAFIGPRAEHLKCFGLKHEARALAEAAGVSLLPGSGVLANAADALTAAESIGYPVMLKSSAGGGGIGMHRCDDAGELEQRFEAVERLAKSQFGDARLFVERCLARPRHVEVQAVGDGAGNVAILGDRDCSLQRRHQKVVEECPAPNLPDAVRARLHAEARALLASVDYLNAGTVEFLYDPDREAAAFLEVNTRLQVEHGVTESVYGIDLVRWMIELAAGELPPLDGLVADLVPTGCAIEARLCAEDPKHGFRPTPGTVSVVRFPERDGTRVDTWLRDGTEIPPFYDSLLAKVIAAAPTREAARRALVGVLSETVVHGVETNRQYLADAVASEAFVAARHDTTTLAALRYRPSTLEVVDGGAHTTVQAYPGRLGYWSVGVPPSGPMDDVSFRLGNRLLGNAEGAAGLEITVLGPTLEFGIDAEALLAGACEAALDRRGDITPVAPWQRIPVMAGDVVRLGRVTEGVRAYLLIAGGLDVPEVFGSAATFTLGGIGGLNGRPLASGDVLRIASARWSSTARDAPAHGPRPTARHVLRVTMGPHCTDDFITPAGIREFLDAEWTVHYHSSRTGVRLVGPRPSWARADGGEAGLHPSNIHDNAYAFGTIDLTGDMPVILGPDGPSLGGFVCPATVIEADRWKLGQLAAGERVRLSAVTEAEARRVGKIQNDAIASGDTSVLGKRLSPNHRLESVIVAEVDDIRVRRAAQDALLVEFGPNVLDIELRLRVHAFEAGIAEESVDGILETTPGIRSLLVRFDWRRFNAAGIVARLGPLLHAALGVSEPRVESRVVHLPLSWDDPACRKAVDRYQRSVRADAPWCPDNIEFIRRINGMADRQAVKDIVLSAEYLVMGLGDVYLGAPVATPVDPRHRLVTTKYNPARTWTAENSVGIGGAYLCIYGMEGPGGYQFVGRTLQVWNRRRRGSAFDEHWLLRPFDRIRFHEVDAEQLAEMREAFPRGALDIDIEPGLFDHRRHRAFLDDHRAAIEDFERRRKRAFGRELDDWRARGLMTLDHADGDMAIPDGTEANGDRAVFVASPLSGSIWSVSVKSGQRVEAGDVLFVVESMKAEFEVRAEQRGVIGDVLVHKGQTVRAGQPLAWNERERECK
ncbi:MAG: urea carboxylase [Gammaproteobacteria bacterium]|nr:urea carboxylase [Gammaproteobacteria bacterium]